jgi:hypothetical protein
VCPLSQTDSRHIQILTPGPHVHRSGSTPASIVDPRGLPRPPLSPPLIKATVGGKYPPPPFSPFLPPHRGEHHHRATCPFDDSFGEDALGFMTIGQEHWPPPLIPRVTSTDTGELLLQFFSSPMRSDLMSTLTKCRSWTELGTPSPT